MVSHKYLPNFVLFVLITRMILFLVEIVVYKKGVAVEGYRIFSRIDVRFVSLFSF